MGDVQLTIHSNFQEVIDKINKLDSSIENLNKDTAEYGKTSKQAYDTATREAEQFNQAQVKNQQTASKSMQMFTKLAGVLGAAFSVTAILKWGKAVLESTGKGADAMEEFKTGVQSMGETLNRAIASGDFSNIIQGLKNAYKEGKLFAQILDEIKQRQAALGVFRETIDTQIAEQRIIMMNAKLSVDVRKAAIEKIIELEKQKRDESLAVAETELNAYLRNSAVQLDASRADEASIKRRQELILQLAKAYETSAGTEELNKKLGEAVALESKLQSLVTQTQIISGDQIIVNKDYTKYNEAVSNLTDSQRELLDLLKVQRTLSDEELIKINQLKAARQSLYTEQLEGEASVARRRNQLMTEMKGDQKDLQEAEEERLKVERELDALISESYENQKELFAEDEKAALAYAEAVKKVRQAFAELVNEYRDEAEVDDIPFNTAEVIKNIEELEQWAEDNPIWSALGFENDEQLQQAKEMASQIYDVIQEIVDAQVEASTRLVEDMNQRIDEQEELVNREFELKKDGLGNNYALEQENLVKMQQQRDQAIKDREKQIRIQKTLSTVEASISLITAAANIMKGFSEIPIVGVILGIAAVGAMIASFIVSQSKIKDATQFAKGGRLDGLRHSQGGIPIPGTGIEVEGGEYVANRRSTQKYLPLLEAINKDDREAMKLFFDRKFINRMPSNSAMVFDIDGSKKLSEIVRQLKSGKSETIYGNGFIIEKTGGYTKRINLN